MRGREREEKQRVRGIEREREGESERREREKTEREREIERERQREEDERKTSYQRGYIGAEIFCVVEAQDQTCTAPVDLILSAGSCKKNIRTEIETARERATEIDR